MIVGAERLKRFDQKWKEAHADFQSAAAHAGATMTAAMWVGRSVQWRVGDHMIHGTVMDTVSWNYSHARVKVRAESSGKEYWIYASRILKEIE